MHGGGGIIYGRGKKRKKTANTYSLLIVAIYIRKQKQNHCHHVNSSVDFSRTTTLESVVSIQETSSTVIDVRYTVATTC